MRNMTAKLIISLFCLAAFGVSANAEVRVAIIDLRKVFDDYYKTKAANSQLSDLAADMAKESKNYMDQYQKNSDDYKKLLDEANNQAVSSDEREKRKKAAEGKLLEMKELETTITQFQRTSRTTLEEKKHQMTEKIVGEIRDVVNAKAKAAGYSLVLDTSAESINPTPVVLYTNGETDITNPVLEQLNAKAPITPKSDNSTKSGSKTDTGPLFAPNSDKKKGK